MTDTHIAKLMWSAYVIQAGGKTFDGKPLPTWKELGKERQSCWQAAAAEAADRIEQLEAALLVALGMLSEMGLSPAEKCELAYEHLLKIKIASAALGEKNND